MKTIPKGPWLGINNKMPPYALHVDKKGDYLADAINVDIDNAGRLRSRKVAVLAQALTAPHSLYQTADGTFFLVRDSVLYEVTLPTYSETLVDVLASNARMSYVEYNGSLYYSNGTDSGRIKGGVGYPLGLPTPASPVLTAVGGSLHAGKYQVCVSYVNSVTGEESGVSAASSVSAPSGGVSVALPAATFGATHANVYISDVNGSVVHLKESVALGTPYLVITLPPTGREANRRYEAPLPAGELFLMNGMLCSFKDDAIFEGVAYRPGYYVPLNHREPEGGRIRLEGAISNVLPTQNGAYVVADKTYWFAGPQMTKAERVAELFPYGGVPGTAFTSPDNKTVGWFGKEGLVMADPTGAARAVMEEAISQTPPVSGVSAFLKEGGYTRVVSCGWCVNVASGATTRYVGYDFTSTAGGYGTAADGIHSLGNAGDVDWSVDLGQENFGVEEGKRLPAAYVGAACADRIGLVVTTPEGRSYDYTSRQTQEGLRMHRIDPGRGLWASWYGLSLHGGARIEIASVSFAPTASTRRI